LPQSPKPLLHEAQLLEPAADIEELTTEMVAAIKALGSANLSENQPHDDVLEHPRFMRDRVCPRWGVRGVADRLERIMGDDLWPPPKSSEILFIK
jgi:glutamine synthetase